jgi:serine phosphatase RsbU (regulator of sigma subunit)
MARQLASTVADVLDELFETRHALWQREAELAAGVPITAHADEEAHLAERLEAVLKAAAHAVDCQAAAAYLLDEATRKLKLRSCWGLPKSRFLDPPRPLRGAAADLEALVGHAVVLEDATLLPTWKVPEEFLSAVCVPISSPTTPFGTLWMYCDRRREFTVDETNLIEIVAGRVASDLEREMLLHQTLQLRTVARQLTHAAQWQHNRMPRIKPLLDGWQVAGWTSQADSLGGDFHDWFVLPDGALAVAVGDAEGKMFEAGLTASALHTSLKSHANYRHSPREMAERINETLWTASVGDQFASLFYATIQPKTGWVKHVTAGHVYASIIGEEVTDLASEQSPPLGTQPDAEYPGARKRMREGDVLLALSEGVHRSLRGSQDRVLRRLIQNNRHRDCEGLLERIHRFLHQHAEGKQNDDRTILVVKRTASPAPSHTP